VFRTRETRLAQGALFTPGTAVPSAAGDLPAARLPLSSSQSLFIPDYNPPREVIVTRHQQGFTVVHPIPAFPSPVTPGGTGSSGFSLSFAPRRAGPGGARQGGDRPGHCLDYVPGISQPPSTYSLTTCDLTSHDHPVLRPSRTRWRFARSHTGGYLRIAVDQRWSQTVIRFQAGRHHWVRPRPALREVRQARRTAGRKALTAKLPGT